MVRRGQAVNEALRRVLPAYVFVQERVGDAGAGSSPASNDTAFHCDDDHDDPCEPQVQYGGLDDDDAPSAEVNAVSVNGKTALFMAAAIGKSASVRMLLVCNCDHRVLSKRRKNALYAAVEGGA